VGINAQIYSDTGGFQGLSFAVPIDVAMKVAGELLAKGEVRRGWLGAAVQDVTQPLAEAFRLPNPAGALVNSVEKDGPAAKAGLRTGDVVLKINGAPVQRATELPPRIADIAPGTRVSLQVWRQGQPVTLEVAVGELKLPPLPATASPAASQEGLGLSVRPLSPREARAIKESSGLLVEAVSGPAAHAGMQPGDVILAVNGEPVATVEKLRTLTKKSGNRAALLVRRGEEKVFLPLSLG
jgi:serine protease Do